MRVHLVPFFGHADLRVIDAEMVARFKATKAQTHAPKTVNNMLGVVSTLFKFAVRWRYCEVNPVTGVGLLKLPPQEYSFWDRQQSDAFLEAAVEVVPRWHPFYLCAIRTGMRQGELFALRWDDVDFVKNQIRVVWNYTRGHLGTPKSGHGRIIPMSPQLAATLKAHRHLRGPLVFCSDSGGYLTRDRVKRPFVRAVRKAGLPMIRLHDLRHSFASQLVMAGVPLVAVQQYLGHSELTMTMRYAHLSPAARQAYVEVLDGDDDAGEVIPAASWAQSGHIGVS
jgi:integrase